MTGETGRAGRAGARGTDGLHLPAHGVGSGCPGVLRKKQDVRNAVTRGSSHVVRVWQRKREGLGVSLPTKPRKGEQRPERLPLTED